MASFVLGIDPWPLALVPDVGRRNAGGDVSGVGGLDAIAGDCDLDVLQFGPLTQTP